MIAPADYVYTVRIYSIFGGRNMPKRTLPDFSSPTIERLRELYRRSDDELVRSTVLEVIRLRDLIVEIDYYRETVERSWKEEGLGQLVALYQFRVLMQAERSRTGHLSPPNPSGEA
jgi:hypothetical protein